MKEELMRRISTALDGDGLASDPELQKELRADPEASKYAKDLTRVGKWLATWPLPEPDEAAFEALAARIDQRMDDVLPAIADVTAAPIFEDDDALRDATVGLLESGEYRLSELPGEPIAEASLASKPASPIARVLLEKKPARGAVEESSGSGEPLSAADLELRLSLDPGPKKKKKKASAPPAVPPAAALPGAAPPATAKSPTPALRVAGEPPKAKKGDRASIPASSGSVVAGSLAPVTELRPAKESRPSGAWWAFAAAACVGLGVFGAATMFESGDRAPTSIAPAVTATTTVMPAAPPEAAPPPPPVVAPPAVAVPVAPAADIAPVERADLLAEAALAEPPVAARGRAESRQLGGSLYDQADREALGPARRSASGTASTTAAPTTAAPTTAAPTTAAPTTAPTPPAHAASPRPAAEPRADEPTTSTVAPTTPSAPAVAPEDLPEAPDRATIQAVLQGVEPTVRACGGDEHGTADVDVVIAGSGRVTTATVHGPFAGTPIGSCIARAVRSARFPAFAQPRFQVTYPFHL